MSRKKNQKTMTQPPEKSSLEKADQVIGVLLRSSNDSRYEVEQLMINDPDECECVCPECNRPVDGLICDYHRSRLIFLEKIIEGLRKEKLISW